MLVAFADESGRAGQTDLVAMAFWVGRWTDWKLLQERWSGALERHRAPYLHMREFAHSIGPFKGWTEAQRRALMADCLNTITDLPILSFGAAVRVADFIALPSRLRAVLQDPYFACYQECLHGLAVSAYFGFPGDRLNLLYSQQDEFRKSFRSLFEWARTREYGERLGVLAFGDMKSSAGLQLADLTAYELLRYFQRRAQNPAAVARHPFKFLCEHQAKRIGVMYKLIPRWLCSCGLAAIPRRSCARCLRPSRRGKQCWIHSRQNLAG